MDTKGKRRSRDAQRTVERLHFKFITAYVENLYRDVYVEAQELFEYVRQKNPGVKDLTKTAEFMSVAMPDKSVPKHYLSKRREDIRRRNTQTFNTQSRMVLNIPLVPLSSITSQPVVASPPSPSPPVVASPPLPSPPVVASPPLPSPPVVASSASPLTSFDTEDPLLLPTDVYQSLLEELKQDPDLWQILNDFNPCDEDMDAFVADDMGDVFMANDISPLEIELEGY